MSSAGSPKIGLALGSGASRGWSHIGVIKTLVAEGIEPDVICGTSVGAMIGASYAAGKLDDLEAWVRDANQIDVMRFFEIQLKRAGFVDLDRFQKFLNDYVVDEKTDISELDVLFAAVATDVVTGREVWFTDGNAREAVRASMALPALFPTVEIDNRWLVDGGLVNPVPVSVCHALGAEFVIAVNLNADLLGRRHHKVHSDQPEPEPEGLLDRVRRSARNYSESLFADDDGGEPGLFDVVANSINIFQDRITRSRLAGDPADVVISPKLAHIGLLDFHLADEAIEEGEQRTRRVIDDIRNARKN